MVNLIELDPTQSNDASHLGEIPGPVSENDAVHCPFCQQPAAGGCVHILACLSNACGLNHSTMDKAYAGPAHERLLHLLAVHQDSVGDDKKVARGKDIELFDPQVKHLFDDDYCYTVEQFLSALRKMINNDQVLLSTPPLGAAVTTGEWHIVTARKDSTPTRKANYKEVSLEDIYVKLQKTWQIVISLWSSERNELGLASQFRSNKRLKALMRANGLSTDAPDSLEKIEFRGDKFTKNQLKERMLAIIVRELTELEDSDDEVEVLRELGVKIDGEELKRRTQPHRKIVVGEGK